MAAATTSDLETTSRVLLDIEGMHCAGCVSSVQSALEATTGVESASVNLTLGQAAVTISRPLDSAQPLLDAVELAGFRAAVATRLSAATLNDREHAELQTWRLRMLVGVVLLVPLVLIGRTGLIRGTALAWSQLMLSIPIQLYVGWPFFRGALQRLKHFSANMDTLVALGTGTAYCAGLFELVTSSSGMMFVDAGMILTFISCGKYMEAKAKGQSSNAIRKLLELAPDEVAILRQDTIDVIPATHAMIDDVMVIRPGERVALDGTVLSGNSNVDEAWLTGESLPVEKQPGENVFAGTINGDGVLKASVTATADATTLSQVVDLVRRAQESKPNIQWLADRVVAWFVPAVLLIALTTLVGWGLVGNWSMGLSCYVAVLVVACPCALGLATPTAVLVASGRGAEAGILIKDARALELGGRATTIVLDKTGTITAGKPQVTHLLLSDGIDETELIRDAAAAERLTTHPLGRAVIERAIDSNIAIPAADALQVTHGEGIAATVNGRRVAVGNERLMVRCGIDLPQAAAEQIAARRAAGQTALLVAFDTSFAGAIFVADAIPDGSKEAIASLGRLGLRVLMLTGDKRTTAEAVAERVGISEVIAEVLPDEKQAAIKRLQMDGDIVVMVGDGINDAPALTAADVGIAIGTGADVAIESADIVLVQRDLNSLAKTIRLSRATMHTIRQNLGWAFIYNIALIPMATGLLFSSTHVRVPPALAAAAMALSSVSVVSNSVLLKWRK